MTREDISWRDSWCTGVEEIDEQHRGYFALVAKLRDAKERGDRRAVVGEVLAELEDYVLEHFATEEDLMVVHSYPKLAEHKKAHDGFAQRLAEFRREYAGGEIDLLDTVVAFLGLWLAAHIEMIDMEMGTFLMAAGHY